MSYKLRSYWKRDKNNIKNTQRCPKIQENETVFESFKLCAILYQN